MPWLHPNSVPARLRRLLPAFGLLAFVATAVAADAQTETNSTNAAGTCPAGLTTRDKAASGTLLLKTMTPGCYLALPQMAADISVKVSGPVARTQVTQRFQNLSDGWVEGVYLFPLPDGAAVDTMRIQVGDRFIEGQVKERQEARQIYERARDAGQAASLVEQDRPNVFTNQVANIGPRQTIVVQIEYQQSLPFDHGRYHLRVPLVVAPHYTPGPNLVAATDGEGGVVMTAAAPAAPDDGPIPAAPVLRPEWGRANPVHLAVHIAAGFPLGEIVSTSHAVKVGRLNAGEAKVTLADTDVVADRDFTLTFAAAAGAVPQVSLLKETVGGSDYALALIVPPTADTRSPPKPREAIFVLDNSGSMGGESIVQAKASLLLALDRLTPADTFNLIRFDDTLTVLFPQPVAATPGHIQFAKGYVSHIEASGGTEMLPALQAALVDPTPNDTARLRQVIFLTDGEVDNEAALFAAIDGKLGRSRLFTVGIGSAPNSYFMAGAARAGHGTYTYVASTNEVAPRMAELFAKLEHPVMTDLGARWPNADGAETWPNPLPDLYAGEPVVLTAKMAHLSGTLVLTGNLEGKPWRMTLDLSQARSAAGIERLWARNKIAALEESRVRGADPTAIDKAVLDVALAHHLTSRVTSLVAVDVKPIRPNDATLTTQNVPLNLPAGWNFDSVFGEHEVREREAMNIPARLIHQLKSGAHGDDAARPQEEEMVLPQGATDSRLLLLLGVMLLGLGLVVARTARAAKAAAS